MFTTNEIKLICFDLDFTLVPSKLIPMYELNRSAIIGVKKKGIECVITTGRSYERAYPYVFSINCKYLIAFGGGVIFKFPEKKILWIKKIKQEKNIKILNILNQNTEVIGISYLLNEKTGKTISFKKNKTNKEFEEHGISLKNIGIWDEKKTSGFSTVRINLFGPTKIIKKIELKLNELNLTLINNKGTLLEITNLEAKKSLALDFLIRKKLNILSSKVMAFGDSLNDLNLFKIIKYGIAVKNAVEPLKKEAFDVCENFDVSGVGKYLYKIILNN